MERDRDVRARGLLSRTWNPRFRIPTARPASSLGRQVPSVGSRPFGYSLTFTLAAWAVSSSAAASSTDWRQVIKMPAPGAWVNHVHILARLSPKFAIADILRFVKSNSSKWINEREDQKERFEWQRGYAAFSVSESQSPGVRAYIERQEEHHRVRTFKEEYMELLKRHNIEFDEQFVFDEEVVG